MRLVVPLLSAFLLLTSACSDEGGGSGFMTACFVDSDCADGFVCAEGGPSDQPYCTLECSSVNDPCEERFGDRAYCAAGAFNCRVRCDSDSECPGDSVCPDICRVP